ncbi:hypothetical protein ABB37_05580 [Leptomonas pyrrhocoris]|uniref:SET domain-containing protein n=1 Tax=Leptomonas pyrrhocoris TaxID=157538 RepID=A0A0M9FZH0_LEPPY|nr:hypothetical protein ABB37_05580 [Leptomonas pyrrhocoris]KPA79046.1 hypothetical protein ABB37_05580 [Leptomonas pyrrhocoris]|eukprot:XP_015657485.1 hypothetical protein ABB37_05580 [Leptomonas pyrrhocoris]
MEAAVTATKNSGNAKFAAGDVAGAIEEYRAGIRQIEATDSSAAVSVELNALHSLLYSNMSNAYLSCNQFRSSWKAAATATKIDPTAWKPWLRFIEARRRDGFPFDALVHSLRYLRPLLRKEKELKRVTATEAAATLSTVEEPLCDELGLLRLSPDIELVEYAGGVAMISRRAFQPMEAVFIEKKYSRTDFEEKGLMAQPDLTTESIVGYFAERLRPEQVAMSARWTAFKKDFTGAWPRSDEEIDADTRETIGSYLRARFPDVPEPAFRELLGISLMCRYNCFHSGFFRTCALANHSCHANIAMKYSSADETVKMIAVDAIQPGELMNVKYLSDAHFVLGVGRRRELLRSWLFWCQCDRCLLDSAPTAISEFVQCPSCQAYSHSALMGVNAAGDPLLQAKEPCRVCGAPIAWTDQQRSLLQEELMHSFTDSTSFRTATDLAAWMREQLVLTERLQLHPEHWVYRVLLYFLAVGLTGMVNLVLDELSEPRLSQSILVDIKSLFGPCGLQEFYLPRCAAVRDDDAIAGTVSRDALVQTSPEQGGGCEALKALVILCRLLFPYYPVNEMWSIHDAICKMVLLHLIYPTPSATLSPAFAMELLQQHGRYVGETHNAKWLHRYSMHKTAFNAKEPLALAKIKKH